MANIRNPSHGSVDTVPGDLLRFVLAFLLPPLGVLMEVGLTKHFWINVVLTLLGFVPGIVHAIWVILRR
jgi:uncharacterized membrane protein YqaE (UPF0057 family)